MKRWISLLTAACLAAGLLAGCRAGDSSSPAASSPAASSAAPPAGSAGGQESAGGLPGDLSGAVSDAGQGVSDALSDAGGAVSGALGGADAAAPSSGGASREHAGSGADESRAAAANAAAPDRAWMLRLVNAQNPLPEDFTVRTAPIDGYDAQSFDMRAADALNALLRDAERDGTPLYLVSAYRSVGRQKALFQRKTAAFEAEGLPREEAERQAALWVARPSQSEHNLGLAADIVGADWYAGHDDLTADFAQTPASNWLLANCARYGFILRYPQGKEDVTGVSWEPWHFRYVGAEAAADIMARGITLEEYLAGA